MENKNIIVIVVTSLIVVLTFALVWTFMGKQEVSHIETGKKAEESAYDLQRKADLRTIQADLELYKTTHQDYPSALDELRLAGINIPQDPQTKEGYNYSKTSSGFELSATLSNGEKYIVSK